MKTIWIIFLGLIFIAWAPAHGENPIGKEVADLEEKMTKKTPPPLSDVSAQVAAALKTLAENPSAKNLDFTISLIALEVELKKLTGIEKNLYANVEALNKTTAKIPVKVIGKMLKRSKYDLDVYLDLRKNPKISEIHWLTRSKIDHLVNLKASRRKIMWGLTQSRIELGIFDEAKAAAKDWVNSPRLLPNDRIEALTEGVGNVAIATQDLDGLKAVIAKIKFLSPKEISLVSLIKGNIFYLEGDYNKCETEVRKFLADPESQSKLDYFTSSKILLLTCLVESKKFAEATELVKSQKDESIQGYLFLHKFLLEKKFSEAFLQCKTVNVPQVDYFRFLKIYTACNVIRKKEPMPPHLQSRFAEIENDIRSITGRSPWVKSLVSLSDAIKEGDPVRIRSIKKEIRRIYGKKSLICDVIESF